MSSHVLAFERSGTNRAAVRQTREERLLHRVLGERRVAQHPQREPVGDAAVAVVELGERAVLPARDERDQRFVREVREVAPPDRSVRGVAWVTLARRAASSSADSSAGPIGSVRTGPAAQGE